MNTLDWQRLDPAGRRDALARAPQTRDRALVDGVRDIIRRVRAEGDTAVADYGRRFDGREPAIVNLHNEAVAQAIRGVPTALRQAIDEAAERITAFHRRGMPRDYRMETAPGVICETRYRGLSRVGLYVPGGSAPLISTVLMLALPAALAGCETLVLATPPGHGSGSDPGNDPADAVAAVNPALLYAARMAGVEKIHLMGGAQAIAAMAFGTASVPGCDKLFGPGNAWVTEAKRQVAEDPAGAAMDMPAGPSEVMVIADAEAVPAFVAADLLAQAEHGPDSQAILLSDSAALIRQVVDAVDRQRQSLDRGDILDQSLSHCRAILTADLDSAMAIANRYAPEHLILNTRDAQQRLEQVTAAGSVFVGPWTPESLGDYCSGTNHVLPTYGWARSYNGLAVSDFMKKITVQQASRAGLELIGPGAATLARAEGLTAHEQAVSRRLAVSP